MLKRVLKGWKCRKCGIMIEKTNDKLLEKESKGTSFHWLGNDICGVFDAIIEHEKEEI